MKKSLMFATVLCGTLAAAPAMAEDGAAAPAMAEDVGADFHALSAMSSPVPGMTETQMASVEGGQLLGGLPIVGPILGALPIVGPILGGL
jgi:hypothetical protein